MSQVPRFLTYSSEPLDLRDEGRPFPRRHVFEKRDVDAVNAALAARRPLLLRGLPGTGKSQLALAAAVGLGRAFVSEVIDARTESRDLLWRFDAVRRLSDAQVAASAKASARLAARREFWLGDTDAGDLLHEGFYTGPGPLWWAFNWQSAAEQAQKAEGLVPSFRAGCRPEDGVVVLLDEIDKADSSVPNGLLGALGDGIFSAPGGVEVACGAVEPLVVITTNEERSLPDAFLRRCAVHHLSLDSDEEKLRLWLLRLGRAHYELEEDVLEVAADMVLEDRERCSRLEVSPPGGAEYLDLLRVVAERTTSSESTDKPLDLLETARNFLLLKQPEGSGH